MKKFILTASFLIAAVFAFAQDWSAGIKTGIINHHYPNPIRKSETKDNVISLTYGIMLNKSWGKNEKWLTQLSLDYYKNTAQNPALIGITFEHRYYTANLNASYLLVNLPKLRWKHYFGPTISLSITSSKGIYASPTPENYVQIKNPDYSVWTGLNYYGSIGLNQKLSAIYNIGASLDLNDMGDFRYNEFRAGAGAGISYKL